MSEDTFRLVITVGVGISALCIVVMAIAAVAVAVTASKLKKKFDGVMEHVNPIIQTGSRLAQVNEKKVSVIVDRAVEISASASAIAANAKAVSERAKDIVEVAKDQAHVYAEIGRDVADRARVQISRVDAAVDDTVDNVQHAGEKVERAVKDAVMKPVREANGLLAGFKAAAGTLRRGRNTHADHVTQDEEMFI